jgi:predicted MFS family arabinose efflux permease
MTHTAERVSLWQNRALTRFWTASTTSMFGATLTAVAVPIIAVRDMGATPAQMGVLAAATMAPRLLLRLPAAAWADATTVAASRVIIRAQLVSGLLVASVPILWLLGALRLPVLFLVVTGVSAVAMVIEGFAGPLLPRLVPAAQLPAANGRFMVSRNAAEISGPGIGGLLFQVVSAPMIMLIDALSYLVASLLMRSMPDIHAEKTGPLVDVRSLISGFLSVFRDRFLRRCMVVVGYASLANGAVHALLVILMIRTVELSATTVGLVSAAGAVGGIGAGVLVERVRARLGLTGTVTLASVLLVSSFAGLPLATPGWIGLSVVFYYELAGSFGAGLMLVSVFSEIPLRVPGREIARGLAVANVIPDLTALTGALIGGFLATAIGVRPTLAISLAVAVLCSLAMGGYLFITLTTRKMVTT